MLIGEYRHTIDQKNRLSLPAKFRTELGKKVVVTPGLDGCLFVFSTTQWKEITQNLSEASFLSSDSRSFNRYLLGGASEVEVDGAGRILVPSHLVERSGIQETAVVIGVSNRVEIWASDAWEALQKSLSKQADSLAERLSGVGIL